MVRSSPFWSLARNAFMLVSLTVVKGSPKVVK